jgi:hypothetical protein
MPFRARHTYKVLPGVRVNLTLKGMSTTVGPRKGARLTFQRRGGRFLSLSLPFGIYWFKQLVRRR